MEHTTFTQIQQNPSYPPDPNAQTPQNAYQYQNYYYPQYTNPNPNYPTDPNAQNPYTYQNQDPTQVQQPLVNPYNLGQYGYSYQQTADGSISASSTYYQYPGNTSSVQTADGSLAASSTYYQKPGGLMANGSDSVNQYAVNTNTWGVNTGTYQNNQPQIRGKWKKAPKVVQSAWCDICHIKCDTNDVFELHKQGKKHKKNLDKLRNAAGIVAIKSFTTPVPSLIGIQRPTAAPIYASTSGVAASNVPMIGPEENPNKASKASKKKKRSKESQENLEMKKQKILEGGVAAEAVRACSICNVVCNSDTVYSYHLAGQKHAAMVKKLAPLTTVVIAMNC